MTKAKVKAWLLGYAWLGTPAEQAAEVDCILAQGGWKYVDDVAEQFAGAAFDDAGKAGADEFALSALYECHDEPHLPTCPRGHDA